MRLWKLMVENDMLIFFFFWVRCLYVPLTVQLVNVTVV